MKKVCAIMLAAAMMLTLIPAAAFAEGEGRSFMDFLLGQTAENQSTPIPASAAEAGLPVAVVEEETENMPEELLVGHPTITKGDFFTEMFGNDTADIDVRALIHGYNLVNWDQNQGVYVFDPTVVTDVRVVDGRIIWRLRKIFIIPTGRRSPPGTMPFLSF